MSEEQSNYQRVVGLILATIAVMDISKAKIRALADAVSVFEVTVDDIQKAGSLVIRDPEKHLRRVQEKGLADLKNAVVIMRDSASALELLVNEIEKAVSGGE